MLWKDQEILIWYNINGGDNWKKAINKSWNLGEVQGYLYNTQYIFRWLLSQIPIQNASQYSTKEENFYEILFIAKERFRQQQEFVPRSCKWKSLLKQLWKNLARFSNNITYSVQRLIHRISASKSLFLY